MRLVAATGIAGAALLLGVAPARAADECNGLMVCIPVAGPWVVIPASRAPSSTVTWRLECPEGVVGGVDARVTVAAVAVDFPGRVGSPVNPGITTADSLLFEGTYAGRSRRATSFRPFIGCIPGSGGGGGRTPTRFSAPGAVKPGEPIVTRVKALRVDPGRRARAAHGCRRGERLLRATHAIGLYVDGEPSPEQLRAVRVVQVVRSGRISVNVSRSGLTDAVRAEVQVQAECAK